MFRIVPLLAGVLTSALVLAAVLLIDHREGAMSRADRINAWLAHSGSLLESELAGHLQLVRGLSAFVRLDNDFTEAEFQTFASVLESDTAGIRSLQLQPGGVIRYITQKERNAGLLGYDLLADPARRDRALRAMRERSFVITGPVPLVQGGRAIIGRLPIFLPSESGNDDRFWGFATIVLETDALLKQAGIASERREFNVAVRGSNGMGARGAVFYGDPQVFDNPHISRVISIPNGSWILAARPKPAWFINWSGRRTLWSVGVPLALALGALIYGLLRWPQRLRQGISQATHELRRLNDRLQTGEAHYKALYEKTPVMVHSLGVNNTMMNVSDHWLKKLGYAREEVIDQHISAFLTPESAKEARDILLPRLWRVGHNSAVPISFVTKSGEVLEIELSSIIDRSRPADTPRTLTVLIDVTERNNAQRMLAERNKELQSANEGLRQFALVASHDLQEPLRKIGIFSSMLEREMREPVSDDGRQALNGIMRAARRLSTLVSDMLKYSRTGNAEFMPVPTDLRQVMDQVLSDLAVVIQEAGARIKVGPLPVVRADPVQTAHLFQNLISNALKYRYEGRPCRIQVTAHERKNPARWEISVKDNGIGFSPEHAENIWQPFHRLHSQAQYAGSGIGLAICAKIAERHHWNLKAVGKPGAGATFNVEVPDAA